MPKPDLSTVPEFYHKYVKLVSEDDVAIALANNTEKALVFLQSLPDDKWNFRYAEGKWTIKEMLQHITDTERIFAYRALCIARGEQQSLPGFDENSYAATAEADKRSREELLEEFRVVRQSIVLLFQAFSETQLQRTGRANNNPIAVNAIGYITAGHMLHHLAILQERYLA